MLYMFLITYDRSVPVDPAETNLQSQHAELEQELRDRGVYAGGAALMPVEGVATMRVKNGQSSVDGPYAETKEVVGGYYVIDCKDREEAAATAARIPVSSRSWVDVRPVALWRPK
jgi:hypothetical protein